MNQGHVRLSLATTKTYKIRGGYLNSTMTFEVQDGKDIVRIRHYCTLNDPNRYEPCFYAFVGDLRFLEADVWYDIKIGREVYKYMTRDETEYPNFMSFLPVP
jgi:hypothetical protein